MKVLWTLLKVTYYRSGKKYWTRHRILSDKPGSSPPVSPSKNAVPLPTHSSEAPTKLGRYQRNQSDECGTTKTWWCTCLKVPCLSDDCFLRGLQKTGILLVFSFWTFSEFWLFPNKKHRAPQHHNLWCKKGGVCPTNGEGGGGKIGRTPFGARGVWLTEFDVLQELRGFNFAWPFFWGSIELREIKLGWNFISWRRNTTWV